MWNMLLHLHVKQSPMMMMRNNKNNFQLRTFIWRLGHDEDFSKFFVDHALIFKVTELSIIGKI